MEHRCILVTGGAGFIGRAMVARLLAETEAVVVNVDKLTYAGHLANTTDFARHPRYRFERADVCDAPRLREIFARHQPEAVVHLAAETHVDRAIDGPADFIQTNLVGAFVLLEAALAHWRALDDGARARFRFLQVSTDEVFGSVAEAACAEDSPYRPNSPYSASKAGADHLARAWRETYGLPIITTRCSNNYGPYQFPEKLIPLLVQKGLAGASMPIYGAGENVRDWLYVEDHAAALHQVLRAGRVGESYNVAGGCERRNIEVARAVCAALDELRPEGRPHERLIAFVPDRPGHDARYALDAGKIGRELGWRPRVPFEDGLRRTVAWYLENQGWCAEVARGRYAGERLGAPRAAVAGGA